MSAPPFRLRLLRQTVCGAAIALAATAQGAEWRFEPSLGVEETLTNNVNLESSDIRRSDWVTQITPTLRITEKGAHTSLLGYVSLPTLLYARTGSENDRVDPVANLLGNWEMVDHLLFFEGSVSVTQQYLSPFGARPIDLTTTTQNRFNNETYRLTPYIKGSAGSDYSYELRDNNIWNHGDSSVVNGAYTNELIGTFSRDPRPLGWAVDIDRARTKFQDQAPQLLELARFRGLYDIDPQVRVWVSGGYEHNDFLLETNSGPIYGLGVHWRPTERSNMEASWEHRFFGTSYNFALENRSPLSVWSLTAYRNITTYPQQLAALPAGDVAGTLNQLFLSRVPDPAARQALINQFILDRGLPPFLSGPVNLYTQQVTLQESLMASAGILGARNTVFFSAYRLHQQPITGSGNAVPDPLAGFTDNTQYGTNVIWTHTLTPLVTFTANLFALRTVDNTETGARTRQGGVTATITSRVAPSTDVYGGMRYQLQHSTVTNDYNEMAVFVGVNHTFR